MFPSDKARRSPEAMLSSRTFAVTSLVPLLVVLQENSKSAINLCRDRRPEELAPRCFNGPDRDELEPLWETCECADGRHDAQAAEGEGQAKDLPHVILSLHSLTTM
mmetsp:Transcript_5709/g.20789  ORF Transcript_5709/g.20789 Transcript_5709/m.20789 type:complete len:106 (+) Transcript_5709:79-396(+)|eukprot:scaffold889_cov379-Prasinococcus_capsulatus_cf.AAC.10